MADLIEPRPWNVHVLSSVELAAAYEAVADQLWLRLIRLARGHRLSIRTGYSGGQAYIDVADYWGHYLAAFSGTTTDECIEQVLRQVANKLAGQNPPGGTT